MSENVLKRVKDVLDSATVIPSVERKSGHESEHVIQESLTAVKTAIEQATIAMASEAQSEERIWKTRYKTDRRRIVTNLILINSAIVGVLISQDAANQVILATAAFLCSLILSVGALFEESEFSRTLGRIYEGVHKDLTEFYATDVVPDAPSGNHSSLTSIARRTDIAVKGSMIFFILGLCLASFKVFF